MVIDKLSILCYHSPISKFAGNEMDKININIEQLEKLAMITIPKDIKETLKSEIEALIEYASILQNSDDNEDILTTKATTLIVSAI